MVKIGAAAAGLAALVLAGPGPARAEPPELQWPVDCRLGEDCWVVHHVDAVPGPEAADFRCGRLTYDDHQGTDIALRDRAAMFGRIGVLAAAAGTVVGTRNSALDHLGDSAALQTSRDQGEECGNGVAIDHGDGWLTQYCHMKSGSVLVSKGTEVQPGDLLGHVGQSGLAQFPHLHLSVRHQGRNIDPFTLLPMGSGCEASPEGSLWSAAVREMLPAEDAPIIVAAGFRPSLPQYEALLEDSASPNSLSVHSPALTFWAMAYGLRENDRWEFVIRDPDGRVFHRQEFAHPKDQIRAMRVIGRRNSDRILRPGVYEGQVSVIRRNSNGEAEPVVKTVRVEIAR